MINKFFKKFFRIKTSTDYKSSKSLTKIFKFFFFIRYLIFIFILSIFFYFFIPKFLNYNTNDIFFKKKFLDDFKVQLIKYDKIEYNIFPSPRLNFKNSAISLEEKTIIGTKVDLFLILDWKKLYQIKKSKIERIIIKNSILEFEINKIKFFLSYFDTLKKEINIKNNSIKILEKSNLILDLKNIYFSNKNLKKQNLNGILFDSKFYLSFIKNFNGKIINFKIPNVGLNISTIFNKDSNLDLLSGETRVKILKKNLFFNFNYDQTLKIYNSMFTTKDFKTTFDGSINVFPYFNFDLILNLKKINIKNILNMTAPGNTINTSLFKKLNGNIKINYKEKQFNDTFINNLMANLILENGAIFFDGSKIEFDGGTSLVNGSSLEYDGFRRINFDLLLNFNNNNKFLKTLKIKKKYILPNELKIKGSINVFSNKINFENITTSTKKISNLEIQNYKNNFEKIILKNGIMNIFDKIKIKDFIIETF
jgi:hypothetical protein